MMLHSNLWKRRIRWREDIFDFLTDTKNGMLMVAVLWNDNSVVNTVSSKVGVHPLQSAKIWSRSDAKRTDIGQPFLIKHYNNTMGGVNRLDKNVDKINIARPTGPRSAGGLYLHSAWTSVSSKCGTCFDWRRAMLTRPTNCWLSVTPLPGPVLLEGLVIQPQVGPINTHEIYFKRHEAFACSTNTL